MMLKPLPALALLTLFISMGGCGGGSSLPAATAEPAATGPLEGAPTVVTPNPPTLTQPAPASPAIPSLVPSPVPSLVPSPVPSPVIPSSDITAANSCGLVNFQADVVLAINAARAQPRFCENEAKPAVAAPAWNDTLFTVAAAHSQDMAQRNYFSHTSPDGKTASDRAPTAGYRFTALGENIAAGQSSVATVMHGWLASAGHCRNIMNAAFTQVAVACVSTSRPQYPTYWTMVLGKPL